VPAAAPGGAGGPAGGGLVRPALGGRHGPLARLPPSRALGGLLRLHLEGAAGSTGLLLAGLLLVHRHRRGQGRLWPALLVVLAAAAAVGVTAHLGGMMAFGEPGAPG